MNGIKKTQIIEAKETYFVLYIMMNHSVSAANATSGANVNITPPKVETPFPPYFKFSSFRLKPFLNNPINQCIG
jgi:hypothetical protein